MVENFFSAWFRLIPLPMIPLPIFGRGRRSQTAATGGMGTPQLGRPYLGAGIDREIRGIREKGGNEDRQGNEDRTLGRSWSYPERFSSTTDGHGL